MFKVGEKCTGIFAAKARLNREEMCYDAAKKSKDKRGMDRAKRKMEGTKKYMALMEEWQPAENLAIGPAILIANIKTPKKRTAIMKQVQQIQETGINPINGKKLNVFGLTGVIIKYLIAKCDHKHFVQEKRFMLTVEAINAIKYAIVVCKENPKAVKFFNSLLSGI